MVKAFKHGRSVILDRVNVHRKERKGWVQFAKQNGATKVNIIYIDPGVDVCKARALERTGHETLAPDMAEEVIDRFCRGMSTPEAWEGPYEEVYIVHDQDEIDAAFNVVKAYTISQARIGRLDL